MLLIHRFVALTPLQSSRNVQHIGVQHRGGYRPSLTVELVASEAPGKGRHTRVGIEHVGPFERVSIQHSSTFGVCSRVEFYKVLASYPRRLSISGFFRFWPYYSAPLDIRTWTPK